MRSLRAAISILLVFCLAATLTVTLRPGDTAVVSGCTTFLELSGNVVRCVTQTRTSTVFPTVTRTPTVTASPTATRTLTPTPTLTSTFLPTITKEATALVGLAIVGDSTQDEYAAPENNRPAVNWVEHLVRSGLPVGTWGGWGEPRRNGYEFNWARSGAVSYNALVDQVPGVLSQIQSGRVSHVLMQIGINDLDRISMTVYGSAVDYGALDSTAQNITEAARQLGLAAPGRVILAPVQDYLLLDLIPEPQRTMMSDPAGVARMQQATAYLNQRVRDNLPAGVVWLDFNAALGAKLAAHRSGDILTLAGQSVQIRVRGSGPSNGFVNDQYMHPETAISGLFAQVYLDAMHAAWGMTLPELTDSEIMSRAQ